MLKRKLNHKYSKGHKEKILERSAQLTAKQETGLLRKFITNKTKKRTKTTAVAIGMPTEVE